MQALHLSEERLRLLIEASQQIVYRMNANWSRMKSLAGKGIVMDIAEPSTDWLNKYLLREDAASFMAAVNNAIAQRSVFDFEHRVRLANGTIGWLHSRALPVLTEEFDIFEWIGTAVDITSRRRAEEIDSQQEIASRRRAEQTLRANEERQAFLFRLSDEFRLAGDEKAVGLVCVELLAQFMGADRCYITELSSTVHQEIIGPECHRSDLPPLSGVHLYAGSREFVRYLEDNKPFISMDVANDASLSADDKAAIGNEWQLGAIVVTPLFRSTANSISALVVGMALPRDWTRDDCYLVQEVGERVCAAIERVRLEALLRASEEKYRLLADSISQA